MKRCRSMYEFCLSSQPSDLLNGIRRQIKLFYQLTEWFLNKICQIWFDFIINIMETQRLRISLMKFELIIVRDMNIQEMRGALNLN